jgi:hypothetical protein
MALPSRIPIIPQLAQSFYKTTDFFIRIRYSCAHGLAPVETQYRFATSIILNLKKFFMRKPCPPAKVGENNGHSGAGNAEALRRPS